MNEDDFYAAVKLAGAYLYSTSEAMYIHYDSRYIGAVERTDSYDTMFDHIAEMLAYVN